MAKRQSIDIPELVPHKNPISHCTKIGNMIFSGGIIGYDLDTGEIPDDLDTQTKNAFAHMKTMIEGAGATLGDIGKVTVFMQDNSNREAVNREWLALFPNAQDRPARHAVKADLPGKMLIQLEMVAVL